jgi:quercetin dioxygenase-like cupin family protein
VFKGSIWWRYGDREEIVQAGEAYYVMPGHTSGAHAGAEFLVFSPAEVMAGVEAHMMQRAQELRGA